MKSVTVSHTLTEEVISNYFFQQPLPRQYASWNGSEVHCLRKIRTKTCWQPSLRVRNQPSHTQWEAFLWRHPTFTFICRKLLLGWKHYPSQTVLQTFQLRRRISRISKSDIQQWPPKQKKKMFNFLTYATWKRCIYCAQIWIIMPLLVYLKTRSVTQTTYHRMIGK
jgi:hypothetical protein